MPKKYSFFLLTAILMIMNIPLMAEAKLEFPHSYFDFGYVPQQSKLTHVFWIKSNGDENLVIERIASGCSCTQAPLDKDVIVPGDSAKLEIIFSSRRYHERVLKKPLVVSNDDPTGRSVTIIARVVDNNDGTFPLMIDPFKLVIETEKGNNLAKFEYTIKNISDEELGFNLIDYPKDLMSVHLPEKIPARGEASGYVRLTDTGLKQVFEKSFTFEVTDEEKTRFSIPVDRRFLTEKLDMENK